MATEPASGFATFEAPMSHETFGGHTEKENYGGVPVLNPLTDTDVTQGVDACRTLARAQWLMAFAKLRITIGTNQGTTSITRYKGQNGVGLSHAPTITWQATGRAQLVWGTTYTDEYDITGTLDITEATGYGIGTAFLNVTCDIVNAYTVNVYFWDAAGSAVSSRSAKIEIETMGDS